MARCHEGQMSTKKQQMLLLDCKTEKHAFQLALPWAFLGNLFISTPVTSSGGQLLAWRSDSARAQRGQNCAKSQGLSVLDTGCCVEHAKFLLDFLPVHKRDLAHVSLSENEQIVQKIVSGQRLLTCVGFKPVTIGTEVWLVIKLEGFEFHLHQDCNFALNELQRAVSLMMIFEISTQPQAEFLVDDTLPAARGRPHIIVTSSSCGSLSRSAALQLDAQDC